METNLRNITIDEVTSVLKVVLQDTFVAKTTESGNELQLEFCNG